MRGDSLAVLAGFEWERVLFALHESTGRLKTDELRGGFPIARLGICCYAATVTQVGSVVVRRPRGCSGCYTRCAGRSETAME